MKWIVLPCMMVLLFSCKKDVSSPALPPTPITFPNRIQSPFGVMIGDIPVQDKIIAAKSLAVNYVRAVVTLNTSPQTGPYIDSLINNGYNVVAEFDYYSPSVKAAPFVSNQSALSSGIGSALKKFHPYLVGVENEEVNTNYHSGSVLSYINELSAATQFLHANHIKVTNGGLTEEPLCILTYRDYLSRGLTAQANDFAKRSMPPAIVSDLPNLTSHPQLAKAVLASDTLIQAYKNMNFDYVNFHWYEPIIERWDDPSYTTKNSQHVDTKAMSEVMTYLNNATGKIVISNEVGEMYNSPGIVQDMMQQFVSLKTPLVIWYSGDGHSKSNNPVALNNSNGSLRSNGQAFLSFLQSNYVQVPGQ